MIKYINGVPNVPEAIGPYSQAVVYEKMAFVSGQIPIDPETGEMVEGGIEVQTNQVMKNLLGILTHLGTDFSQVLKATIFLTDLSTFQTVNSVYAHWLGGYAPARATVEVSELPRGALVEIELVVAMIVQDTVMLGHGTLEELEQLEEGVYSAKGGDSDRSPDC